MKKRIFLILGVILALSAAGILLFLRPLLLGGAARVLIASPDGHGKACNIIAPCDLSNALARARAATVPGDVLVYLRGGTYPLTETWKMTAADSGKNGHWTIFRAFPNETPVIIGGAAITGWIKEADGIYSAAWTGAAFRQLYAGGKRMVRARTPNRENDADMGPYLRPLAWRSSARKLAVRPEDVVQPRVDANGIPLDNSIEMVLALHWHLFRLRLSAVTQEDGITWLDFHEPERSEPAFGQFASINPEVEESYYWENDRSFLDAPEEWFLDEAAGRVYFMPPKGMDPNQSQIIVPQVETLLSISGGPADPVRRLRFEGLTFAYSTWLRPSEKGYVNWQAAVIASSGVDESFPGMVEMSDVEDIELRGCVLSHTGAHGLVTSGVTHRLAIVNNLFEDLSAGAVMLGVDANPKGGSLEDRVAGNTIRAAGRDYSDAVGIWASFPNKLVIAHNEIYNLPYSGISVGWRWDPTPTAAGENLIEANHIYQVMQKHADGAAIYTLGSQPGTIIRENYIHDLVYSPFASWYPIVGIYLDEGSNGISVVKNYIKMPKPVAVMKHLCGDEISLDDPLLAEGTQAEKTRIQEAAGPETKQSHLP